jgi:predicted nuclease of predicted toxin-antitoxin system
VKRVLFDEDMPRQLRRDLPGFAIRTVQEEGWSSVKNGELLRRASQSFDVLVTADQRLPYQQHIAGFTIGVVVIVAVDTRLPHLRTLTDALRAAIAEVAPGTVVVVKAP